MNTTILARSDSNQVAKTACEWFVERVRTAINERERCTVSLSGGFTPKLLYQLLAELPLKTIPWSQVHLIWGDERNVPLDHPDSNFEMVRQSLLAPLGKNGPNVYPVPIDIEQPEKAAERYEATLKALLGASDHRFVPIDIVLLGLGDDAHTASLFPNTKAIDERSRWVVSNWVDKLSAHRITLTAPILNVGRDIAFLVCGSSKCDALQHVWHSARNPSLYPAQLIEPLGNLWWILDSAAFDSLEPPADADVFSE